MLPLLLYFFLCLIYGQNFLFIYHGNQLKMYKKEECLQGNQSDELCDQDQWTRPVWIYLRSSWYTRWYTYHKTYKSHISILTMNLCKSFLKVRKWKVRNNWSSTILVSNLNANFIINFLYEITYCLLLRSLIKLWKHSVYLAE